MVGILTFMAQEVRRLAEHSKVVPVLPKNGGEA